MRTVVRITRHPADSDRIAALRKAFGDDVVIHEEDLQYGNDPVVSVKELMTRVGDVVAVEAIAPFGILMKIVDAKRQLGDVIILRAQFRRGEDGRAIATSKDSDGRDVLAFSHYEVIERIEFQTRPLDNK